MDDDSVLNAVIVSCILGIAVVLGLIVFSDSSAGFTELYLLDYEKVPVNGTVSFTWGVTNHEGVPMNYSLGVFVDDVNVNVMVFSLEDNSTFTDVSSVTAGERVSLMLLDRDEEVHFWVVLDE